MNHSIFLTQRANNSYLISVKSLRLKNLSLKIPSNAGYKISKNGSLNQKRIQIQQLLQKFKLKIHSTNMLEEKNQPSQSKIQQNSIHYLRNISRPKTVKDRVQTQDFQMIKLFSQKFKVKHLLIHGILQRRKIRKSKLGKTSLSSKTKKLLQV